MTLPAITDKDAPPSAKKMLRHVTRYEIDRQYSGPVNEANVYSVAEVIRSIFEGKVFTIASVHYADSRSPDIVCATDCSFESQWTDHLAQMVRVWTSSGTFIGFSAGGYLWSLDAAPKDGDHSDYRYAHISFSPTSMKLKFRSASRDLHIHVFVVQELASSSK